jgi:hypothetical protein
MRKGEILRANIRTAGDIMNDFMRISIKLRPVVPRGSYVHVSVPFPGRSGELYLHIGEITSLVDFYIVIE